MTKRFECKDLGMACEFKAEGNEVEEVVTKAEEHASTAHNMPKGEETRNQIRALVKEAAA